MPEYCSTCLSSDRRLTPLASLKPVLDSLLWFQHELNMETSVCWECRAVLEKIQQFQQQVMRAKRVLAQLLKASMPKQSLGSLSNLSTHTNTTFDESVVYNEREIYDEQVACVEQVYYDESAPLDDIKTEFDDFDSSEYLDEDLVKTERTTSDGDVGIIFGIKQKYKHVKHKNTFPGENEEKIKAGAAEFNKDSNGEGDTFLRLSKEEEKFIITRMSLEEVLKIRESERNSERYKSSPYKCGECIKKFYFKKLYDKHMEAFHSKGQGSKICQICSVRFPREESLRRHHEAHFKRYRCRECGFSHHRLYEIVKHSNTEHEMKSFSCKFCDKNFTSFRRLRYHRESVHLTRPACALCSRTFVNVFNLKRHVATAHDKTDLLEECSQCGGKYRQLRAHMRRHAASTGGEDAFCAECGKQFRNAQTYRTHLRVHAKHRLPGALKYACTYCERKFAHKTNLTRHVASIHTKTYPFRCDTCSKGFHRKDRLQSHIQEKHEGVPAPKDKICTHCGKAFKDAQVLRCHVRTHTGEKPFACSLCPWRFAQRTALNTHVRALHSQKKKGTGERGG